MTIPKLHVARPTDNIEALLPFYKEGPGFDVLYQFNGHDGFDGVMLGKSGAPYHFEFTRVHGHEAGRADLDNLLVFYLLDPDQWQAAIDRMENAGFAPVPAFNGYWDQLGRTFEDPDGYRVHPTGGLECRLLGCSYGLATAKVASRGTHPHTSCRVPDRILCESSDRFAPYFAVLAPRTAEEAVNMRPR